MYISKKNIINIEPNQISIFKKYANYHDEMYVILKNFMTNFDLKIIHIFVVFEIDENYLIKNIIKYDKLSTVKYSDFAEFINNCANFESIGSGFNEVSKNIDFMGFELLVEDSNIFISNEKINNLIKRIYE